MYLVHVYMLAPRASVRGLPAVRWPLCAFKDAMKVATRPWHHPCIRHDDSNQCKEYTGTNLNMYMYYRTAMILDIY